MYRREHEARGGATLCERNPSVSERFFVSPQSGRQRSIARNANLLPASRAEDSKRCYLGFRSKSLASPQAIRFAHCRGLKQNLLVAAEAALRNLRITTFSKSRVEIPLLMRIRFQSF